MAKLYRWYRAALLAIIVAAALFLIYELILFTLQLQRDFQLLTGSVNTLLMTANAAAVNARDASEQARLAAIEQRVYWNKTSLETYKTMASLRLTITRADHSINDVLVPKLGAALDSTTNLSTTAASNLTQIMEGLQPTLGDLARASAAAADTLADPAIRNTLTHMDETSARAADVAASAAQTSASLAASAKDVQAFIHRETTPIRGTWNTIKAFLREFAGPSAQIATATK